MPHSRDSQPGPPFAFCGVLLFVSALCLPGPASADEPVKQFLDALRARGYFDTAIDYIDQQQKNPSLAEDLKQSLGFERAMTLLEMSRRARTSGTKAKSLAEAQATLQAFANTHARHELAAEANSQLAQILFERAQTAVWQSEAPPAGTTKALLLQEARSLVKQSRVIYQKALQLAKTKLAALPPPAQQDGDKEVKEKYSAALASVVSNSLRLAQCTYQEGQTFARGSSERKDLLLKASKEFTEIHEEYRRWTVGPIARLWQGKCYEELDDIPRALGIYNEVLSHGDDPLVKDAKELALRFRLICLNHENKRDHELAVVQAGNYLSDKSVNTKTSDAVGIRWEKARAHDLHGQSLKDENPERERELRLALAEATEVSRYPTPYKDVANNMVQRLKAQLGDRQGPPKDFATAYGLATASIKKVPALKAASTNAKSKTDRQKASEDLRLELIRTDELLTLALQLADSDTNPTDTLQARYLLSFVKLEQRQSFDAVVLAQYVMKYGAKKEPETAMNAAEVAWVASVQAYNAAGSNNAAELELLEWISNETVRQWPDSNRANEARMSLGMIYRKASRTEDASRLYNEVPKAAGQYGEAQLKAGQTWWEAAMNQSRIGNLDEERAQKIKTMTESAETHLRAGLKAMTNPALTPPTVTAAKLSLAQILNSRSEFPETIKILTEGDQSVINEVIVPDGTPRPETGIKSKNFASLAYQVLQRAYIGTQDIDEALAAMTEMEKIGGPDTQIYVQLGQELEREIERLKTQNETERLGQLRSSFEKFLAKVFERKDRQNYNSLIWIAETYRGLGQGMSGDQAAAATYFQRAGESYQQILDKNLVDEKRKTIVELRLVSCRRSTGDFAGAMEKLRQILAQHPRDVNVQFEAANLLRAWGGSGQPEKLNEAIGGTSDKTIWGWVNLSQRLRGPSYVDKFFEARYEMVQTRRDYAKLGDASKKEEMLKAAVRDIEFTVATQGAFDDPWWGKFDDLYQTLQRDQGSNAPKALEKPEEYAPAAVIAEKPPESTTDTPAALTSEVPEVKKPESNSMLGLAIALPIALLAAGGMWFFMGKPRKKSPSMAMVQQPAPSFAGIGTAPVKRKRSSASGSAKRPAKTAADPGQRKAATPEQIAAAKRARAAKRKAQAAAEAGTTPAGAAKKKIVVKKKAAPGADPAQPTAKKRVKVARKAPKKPPEAS